MKRTFLVLLALGCMAGCSRPEAEEPEPATPPERPAIVGIANFVVMTDSLEDARTFYNGYLGYEEAFSHTRPDVDGEVVAFKVNDKQFIELSPTLQNEDNDKLIQIGFETTNAQQLRDYLASKGVTVPDAVGHDPDGNLSFRVTDPEGHKVEFVEYRPDSVQMKTKGRFLPDTRISDHMLHVGVHMKDEEGANAFYKDILDFRPLWRGGMTDERVEWVSLLVPDGDNWIEYMMWEEGNPPDARQLGVWHHVCVGTEDIQHVYKTVVDRGYHGNRKPSIGRDGRWLLHLYDKHNTRTEVMVRKPAEEPCCDELTDPYTD